MYILCIYIYIFRNIASTTTILSRFVPVIDLSGGLRIAPATRSRSSFLGLRRKAVNNLGEIFSMGIPGS